MRVRGLPITLALALASPALWASPASELPPLGASPTAARTAPVASPEPAPPLARGGSRGEGSPGEGALPELGVLREGLAMSLGTPSAGALLNGMVMPRGEHWDIAVSDRVAWATPETIEQLIGAIEAVNRQFPGAHPLPIGHLSAERGGRLSPHRSHQSGRDVDTGYYYVPGKAEWYRPATSTTLDRERTWAFLRALVTDTDVEMMFIDRAVQKLIKEHALAVGEDPEWLDTVFQYGSRHPEPLIRHTWGHRTHVHIRFFNPEAQARGAQAYGELVRNKRISPQFRIAAYKVKPSDTAESIAKLAGTTEAVLLRTNRGKPPVAGHVIAVPVRGQVAKVARVAVPPRRLPPGSDSRRLAAAGAESHAARALAGER